MDRAAVATFLGHPGARQLAYREGRNATVSVWESGPGRSLKVNGKADASDHGDMDTEIMLGLAPVAARPQATSALVIGYGSGVTARVLADMPGMQRVRVVEIEPAVLAMSRFFEHVNDTVLARPGVSAVVDDARSALQLDRARYDVISSEPSNIWLAGVATLYTPEFYRIVRRRLADDGVFCQWVQLYQVPVPVVAGVVQHPYGVSARGSVVQLAGRRSDRRLAQAADVRCGVARAAGGAGRRAGRARAGVPGGGCPGAVLRPPAARLDRGGTARRARHDRPQGRPAPARVRSRAPLPRHRDGGRFRLARRLGGCGARARLATALRQGAHRAARRPRGVALRRGGAAPAPRRPLLDGPRRGHSPRGRRHHVRRHRPRAVPPAERRCGVARGARRREAGTGGARAAPARTGARGWRGSGQRGGEGGARDVGRAGQAVGGRRGARAGRVRGGGHIAAPLSPGVVGGGVDPHGAGRPR